jgi:tRNA(Ile)-lysidine synthase
VRVAVRRALPPAATVAVAVSGGADSLALAAALAHLRPGAPALVVDHGLQDGSARVAARAAEQCAGLGLAAQVLGPAPLPASGGPEAAARALRYALLEAAAPGPVLLGHTRDDQAETVLLGLARGAGARSLAGMAPVRGRWLRPLLDLPRALVRSACAEAGLTPWPDPHNAEDRFARVRVRALLPALDAALGPGVPAALARTARLLREDADALDALTPDTDDCAELAALPAALRARALHRLAVRTAGRPVTSAHVDALRALVEHWHGQGPVGLPGGAALRREAGRLVAVTAG